MKKRVYIFCCILIFGFFNAASVYALVGTGFHWGFDFSLDTEDSDYTPVIFYNIAPDTLLKSVDHIKDTLQSLLDSTAYQALLDTIENYEHIITQNSPISLRRYDWQRLGINFGGKVFFDEIPFFDAAEISFNIGSWQYKTVMKYPNGVIKKSITWDSIEEFGQTGNYETLLEMDSVRFSIKELNADLFNAFGITETPFVKVHFDFTVRKNLIAVPSHSKLFRLYLGLGVSLHMATPILTAKYVEKFLKYEIAKATNKIDRITESFSKQDVLASVLRELKEEAKNPTFGMHIIGGTMVKLPVIPVGFYCDTKFMIPFGDFDDYVDLGGIGFLLNLGIALAL